MPMSDIKILRLVREWAKAKRELFRFGAEEYATAMSPMYAQEHGQPKALREYRRVKKRMEKLSKIERELKWKLYEAARPE